LREHAFSLYCVNMRSRSLAAISCQGVTKVFGGHRVVDGVSFDVEPGSIVGFVGANGAGKSTTMRMLLGLVAPTSGRALIHGRPYRDLIEPRRRVGAVLDGPGAHPGHTGLDHLAITCTGADLDRRRAGQVLDQVGLADAARRRVGTYSLGMRQRLALAGALLGDPPVLILDEPANGLDPPGMRWLRSLLRTLADEGRAILVSSHLLAELAELADRVLVIDRGRVVADATVASLAARGARVELRCADPTAAVAALVERGATAHLDASTVVVAGLDARTVGEIVTAAGAGPIHALGQRSSSIEDAYFDLAGGPEVRSGNRAEVLR
jgi:ABC-2 type transport system ATP-binding protein